MLRNGKVEDIDFNEFVRSRLSQGLGDLDPHFAPQVKWGRSFEELGIDFVAKFENLEKDWAVIAEKINCSSVLPHLNVSTKKGE